ncbi:MAG: YceI family protein [Actinobacteria bacterium]|nr:YceI family protein [Actinomycetota bacterium]
MSTALATRTVAGQELPTPGTWEIDRSHSSAEFVVRHLMVSKVRGRFGDFAGSVEIGEAPEASSVAVTLQAASIETGESPRDEHLRSADFLDVESFPTLAFRSTGVEAAGKRWKVTGDLTIRDVTRPVVLDVEFGGAAGDPWGGQRAAFSASTEIDREDFGLTWNQVLETGGVLVGKTIKIELEVEAVRQ